MAKLSERLATEHAEAQRLFLAQRDSYDGAQADAYHHAMNLAKEHEAASGWRPIGEAPKDGSAVIVGAHGCDRWSWWTAAWWTEFWGDGYWLSIGPAPAIKPTHYLPLPPPPESEQ